MYSHLYTMAGILMLGTVVNLAADAAQPQTAGTEAGLPFPSSTPEDTSGETAAVPDIRPTPGELKRLEDLNLLSTALVTKAGSGSAAAHKFRLEARMYRELLRQTMLGNREQPANRQVPQPLLLDMVRMSALLHSAADCKTGFIISCPADLMQQLRSQQARITQGLKMARMMYD
ncbi:MAG TPA: hypothetical protein VM011_05230 [Gammaproteobacteria bacterium]|nr:hypothetical protein [Gammaproteobacteria bacterium]